MAKTRWSVLIAAVLWTQPAWATPEISPSFLGMYRKTMSIENELFTYAARYGIDPRLARAVLIQESGGNPRLVSSAGAWGYFQVMPKTFRALKVRTNIEAGIKYLAYLKQRFDREDYAIAAYNAGPTTISQDRPLRLETLQYVINVGHYKSVLRLHEPEIRHQAETLRLRQVRRGDSWETLAQATGVSTALLHLYNPFLAVRPLRAGARIAYPSVVPPYVLEYDGPVLYYTSRIGDSYLNLALVFRVDLETFRRDNDLWRLQQLPVGVRLKATLVPASPFYPSRLMAQSRRKSDVSLWQSHAAPSPPRQPASRVAARKTQTYTVQSGDTLGQIARRYGTSVQALKRANGLHSSFIRVGTTLKIPDGKGVPSRTVAKKPRTHKVRQGETLGQIARRYGTSVQALKRANGLRSSLIRVGVSLKIPG